MKNEIKYECRECGGSNLEYEKYVKCVLPVENDENGHITYGPSVIDEDDTVPASYGFQCRDCKHSVWHCDFHIRTEEELLSYLNMDPAVRQEQEQDYIAMIDAEIQEQERREQGDDCDHFSLI